MTGALSGLALAAILGLQDPTSPAPATQEPPTLLDDVVVEGRMIETLAREFVSAASAPPNYRGLARWNREVCLGVVGLRRQVAEHIIDRVSDVARSLDVELGQPGCAPNAVIVATSDGRGLAASLVAERRRAFRIGFSRSNRGSAALEVFRTSDAPVRWWHISFPYCADTGKLAIRIFQGPTPCASSYNRSMRGQGVADYLSRVLIILDVPRLEGADLSDLSDYLAMLVLAQIDPEGDTSGLDTVLNVLNQPGNAGGLTEWDRAYLEALYAARPGRVNAPGQADALAERMTRPISGE